MSQTQVHKGEIDWKVVRPDPPNDEQVHVVPVAKSQPKHDLDAKCWCEPVKERVEPGSDPLFTHNLVQ